MRINLIFAYVAFVALCWQIELTNSRTSTQLWKLNTDGKITGHVISLRKGDVDSVVSSVTGEKIGEYDKVFYTISTTTLNEGNSWVRQSPGNTINFMAPIKDGLNALKNDSNRNRKKLSPTNDATLAMEETLDCGKPVNFTYYDYLIGVGQRFNHPLVPEPEVAYSFLKSRDETAFKNFDITALERRLKRAKREKPRSVQLYNQIGNYWRIIGDARQAIECFRRALAMSPTNAEVLLNLARVLYHLQYLDDAIHLTRRSLEMQPIGRSAWEQYFTLGEIFKAYGIIQESILHLRHALELYPGTGTGTEPILKALRDIENSPSSTLHVYTVVIILTLVVAVFVVIITTSVNGASCNLTSSSGTTSFSQPEYYEPRPRHFNRALAMRSLKGLSSSRSIRHRKT